jgi:TorA maturation chaperone TorD
MNTRSQPGDERFRINMYTLLAALLARPPADVTLRLIGDIQPGRQAFLAGLEACWRDLHAEALKHTIAQLDEEFHSLFIGLGLGEVVPYGSWYLVGHLMDNPLARLRGDLAALGIERRPRNKETEDHAAALCETMALICDPDMQIPRAQRRLFFHNHVASWMPRFFKDLHSAPSARFYRAVGRIGEMFLQREEQSICKENP